MKFKTSIQLIILCSLLLGFSGCSPKIIPLDERTDMILYLNRASYLVGKKSAIPAYAKIRTEDHDYISISDIYISRTNKRIKKKYSWLIEYNKGSYLNTYSSNVYNEDGLFVKLDEVGKIMAFIIDDKTSPVVKQAGNLNTAGAGGLIGVITGAIVSEISKSGRNWTTKSGEKVKILVANVRPKGIPFNELHISPKFKLLSKSNFNELLNTKHSSEQIAHFRLEGILDIIKKYNLTEFK